MLSDERRRLIHELRALDTQVATVLTLYGVLVVIQFKLGSRGFLLSHVAPDASGLQAWGWWFVMQGLTGFVIPIVVLLGIFGQAPGMAGLGRGDWRLGLKLFACYLPVVIVGTWVLSDGPAYQAAYPHYRPAADDWVLFAFYHGLFLIYWIGWEYLWRGFVLFGTARVFGLHAIFIQAVPFMLLHLGKPVTELALSLLGGIVLGAVVWRCRSFWIAVPIHAAQMAALDFWCSLRLRTGASGIDPGTLLNALHGL